MKGPPKGSAVELQKLFRRLIRKLSDHFMVPIDTKEFTFPFNVKRQASYSPFIKQFHNRRAASSGLFYDERKGIMAGI